LDEVGLFFVHVALVVGPGLKLHDGVDGVGLRRAAAPEFRLAERSVGAGLQGADERRRRGVQRILVIADHRVTDVSAAGLVILKVIGAFFVGIALEVGPGLELHRGRNDVGAGRAAAEELRLALGGIHRRVDRADQKRRVRRVLVVMDLGVADADAVRLVVLQVVHLLFAREALEVGPGLEFHRRGDRVGASGSAAEKLGFALSGVAVGVDGADEGGGVRRIFVVVELRVADGDAVRAVILDVIGLFFAGDAQEVGGRLQFHRRRDDV